MKLELNHILEKLTETVNEVGRFTQDEVKVASTLRKNIEIFQLSVNDATQDNDISDDQLHDIIILRDGILTNLNQFSTKSEIIENLVNEIYTRISDFTVDEGYEKEIRESQDAELLMESDSKLSKDSKDIVAGLKYKPYDINAILIMVFFVHMILIFISWVLLFIFDIFAFFSIFQIINDNAEKTHQRVSNHNEDIEQLKEHMEGLRDQLRSLTK